MPQSFSVDALPAIPYSGNGGVRAPFHSPIAARERSPGFQYDATHAFETVSVPGAQLTVAQAIGDRNGQAAGIEGYLFQNGTFQPVMFPGASSTCACGIHNRGVYQQFAQPGCQYTGLSGINDQRVVVGSSTCGNFIATPLP